LLDLLTLPHDGGREDADGDEGNQEELAAEAHVQVGAHLEAKRQRRHDRDDVAAPDGEPGVVAQEVDPHEAEDPAGRHSERNHLSAT
jgi:hypothetical protein